MTEITSPPGRWQYGLHPEAAGLRVRSLARIVVQLGEALRVEMEAQGEADDSIRLQYYIATDAGPWALWLTTTPADLATDEAAIKDLAPLTDGE
jgi:hypothetical protein